MDPSDPKKIALPVSRGELDYAKPSRLISGEAWCVIPRSRYLGNAVLSLPTRIASGYWHARRRRTVGDQARAMSGDPGTARKCDRGYTPDGSEPDDDSEPQSRAGCHHRSQCDEQRKVSDQETGKAD